MPATLAEDSDALTARAARGNASLSAGITVSWTFDGGGCGAAGTGRAGAQAIIESTPKLEMTPYLSDIRSSFTIRFNLSRSVLATTLLFSAACIFTVEVHTNPMWESADTRGADQECMCAASLSVELLAMRVIRNRRNARRRLAPAGAPDEAPSENSARWGDSTTRNPDTPPPIGPPAPEPHTTDASGRLEHRVITAGGSRARPVTAPACVTPALAPHCDDRTALDAILLDSSALEVATPPGHAPAPHE
jgi:hypothetical protein